jgi:hypothetical protein
MQITYEGNKKRERGYDFVQFGTLLKDYIHDHKI